MDTQVGMQEEQLAKWKSNWGKGKGAFRTNHWLMKNIHTEDSSKDSEISEAPLIHSLTATETTVLASKPGWLLLALPFRKETTRICMEIIWVPKFPLCYTGLVQMIILLATRQSVFSPGNTTSISKIPFIFFWSDMMHIKHLNRHLKNHGINDSTANALLSLKDIQKQKRD